MVLATSLLVSWVVAVMFAPLIDVKLLPKTIKKHDDRPGFVLRHFRRMLLAVMRWHWTTVVACLALLAAAAFGMRFVQQQFFPASDRPALLVDLTLPENGSAVGILNRVEELEVDLKGNPDVVIPVAVKADLCPRRDA